MAPTYEDGLPIVNIDVTLHALGVDTINLLPNQSRPSSFSLFLLTQRLSSPPLLVLLFFVF